MKKTYVKQGRSLQAFVFINLVISIGIVALLVVVALNAYHQIRVDANDRLAAVNMATINNAVMQFRKVNAQYPQSFIELRTAQPPYLPEGTFLASASELGENAAETNGYEFRFMGDKDPAFNYLVGALPADLGVSGSKFYLADFQGIREVSQSDFMSAALATCGSAECRQLVKNLCDKYGNACVSTLPGGSGGGFRTNF